MHLLFLDQNASRCMRYVVIVNALSTFFMSYLTLLVYVTSCVMIQLVQKALKARKFKGPVAGPVGMYLKIVNGKEKYAKIAEYAIGQGNLDRFIVTNQSDMQLMNKLRKDAGCGYRDCPLYQISPRSTDEKYNTPAPPNGVETVTSVVSVENAMVFNFLVDSCKIDESALADSKDDSENKLLNKDSSGKCSIRGKVKKVYCLPNGDFWQVNKGFLNITSNERPLKQTIGVDRSAAIDSAKHEVEAIQRELERNKREEATIEAELKKAKKEWNLRNKERATLSNNISNMEQLLEELKEEADASGEVPSIDTTEFENDITAAEDEVDELKKKESAISQEIEELEPEVDELKKKLDETVARNGKILEDMDKVEAKLEDIIKGQNRRQEVADKARARVEDMEKAVAQQDEVIKERKEEVASALEKARRVQFAVTREEKIFEAKAQNGGIVPDGINMDEPTDQDLESIEIVVPKHDVKKWKNKIDNTLKKIEKEKERKNLTESDPVVARDKYLRAKRDLDSKMTQIEAIEENVKLLRNDIKERKKRWIDFRSHIAQMTNISFDDFLNKKNSAGSVEFDHDNQQLNLIVQKVRADWLWIITTSSLVS